MSTQQPESPPVTADSPGNLHIYPDKSGVCQWIDIIETDDPEGQRLVHDELHNLCSRGIELSCDLIDQLVQHETRPAVHLADHEHLSFVFHAIMLQNDGEAIRLKSANIELTVGKDHLITVRDPSLDTLFEHMREVWQSQLPSYTDGPMAFFVYRLLKSVVMDYHEELEGVPELLVDLERAVSQPPDELFTTQDTPASVQVPFQVVQQRIFTISRVLLEFRKYFGPLRRVIDQICELAEGDGDNLPFSLQHSRIELFDLRTQVEYLIELTDTYRDMVTNVIGAYQSSLSNYLTEVSNNMADASNRLNVNMQRLTVIATILTTASAIVGFYGMNLTGLGIGSQHPVSAFVMLAALVCIGVIEYHYFKRKGWV